MRVHVHVHNYAETFLWLYMLMPSSWLDRSWPCICRIVKQLIIKEGTIIIWYWVYVYVKIFLCELQLRLRFSWFWASRLLSGWFWSSRLLSRQLQVSHSSWAYFCCDYDVPINLRKPSTLVFFGRHRSVDSLPLHVHGNAVIIALRVVKGVGSHWQGSHAPPWSSKFFHLDY